MSRDMHFAFDKGFLTITDDYKVMVSENLKGDWLYEEYNGKPIFVPSEDYFKPNKLYLAHHRKEVFNTFKQIRQLPK
jgi:predicted restriction endonuclease